MRVQGSSFGRLSWWSCRRMLEEMSFWGVRLQPEPSTLGAPSWNEPWRLHRPSWSCRCACHCSPARQNLWCRPRCLSRQTRHWLGSWRIRPECCCRLASCARGTSASLNRLWRWSGILCRCRWDSPSLERRSLFGGVRARRWPICDSCLCYLFWLMCLS